MVQLYDPYDTGHGGLFTGANDRYAGWVTFAPGEDDPKSITFTDFPYSASAPECQYEVWIEAFTYTRPDSTPTTPPGSASVSLSIYV
ncbi:hypothetical protein ACFYPT_42240 [Streptomyces sp. NPDC005529]|uniref:hypothetical protein n=1 Tax=unclassified Streptomyces TaxID=2593676 RepID=UPI0033B3D5DE